MLVATSVVCLDEVLSSGGLIIYENIKETISLDSTPVEICNNYLDDSFHAERKFKRIIPCNTSSR